MNPNTQNTTTPRGANGQHPAPSARDLLDETRKMGNDLAALTATAQHAVNDLQAMARDRLERRPYATLAVAAGVGYVLGGGVPSGLVRLLIGLGGRLALERVVSQLAANATPPE